jgi:hypothetical protein
MALVGSCRRLRTPIWAFSRSYEGEFGVPAGGKWPIPLISVRVPDVLQLGGQVRHNRIPPPGPARPERTAIRCSHLPTRGMCCDAGSPFRLLLVVRQCLASRDGSCCRGMGVGVIAGIGYLPFLCLIRVMARRVIPAPRVFEGFNLRGSTGPILFREQHIVVSIAVEWLFRASVNRYCGASAGHLVASAQ